MDYCAEMTKISMAMLINETYSYSDISNFVAHSGKMSIKIDWQPLITGKYNLYRSTTSGLNFTKINSIPIQDSVYIDTDVHQDTMYYYKAFAINCFEEEGFNTEESKAMLIPLNPGILIVDDCIGGILNPADSMMDSFYDELFENYTHAHIDLASAGALSLKELGEYSTVFWHADNANTTSFLINIIQDIKAYTKAGGNFFLTSNRASMALANNAIIATEFSGFDDICKTFKISKTTKKIQSKFFGANPVSSEYNAISIDTNKTTDQFFHHLFNTVEAIYPSDDASVIYKYSSNYDSTSVNGSMINMPVGIEYLGNDYKMAVLSFPLYYMKLEDAKELVNTVVHEKFGELVGLNEITKAETVLKLYPNPAKDYCIIEYKSNINEAISINVFDINRRVVISKKTNTIIGNNTISLNINNLERGIYIVKIESLSSNKTTKLIVN